MSAPLAKHWERLLRNPEIAAMFVRATSRAAELSFGPAAAPGRLWCVLVVLEESANLAIDVTSVRELVTTLRVHEHDTNPEFVEHIRAAVALLESERAFVPVFIEQSGDFMIQLADVGPAAPAAAPAGAA